MIASKIPIQLLGQYKYKTGFAAPPLHQFLPKWILLTLAMKRYDILTRVKCIQSTGKITDNSQCGHLCTNSLSANKNRSF